MNIECDFEPLVRESRQRYDFAKLMDSEPISSSMEFDWAKVSAPTCDRRETATCGVIGRRPIVQLNGLTRGDPFQATRRNGAMILPDVFTDRHIAVVAVEDSAESQLLPHLSEAGVDVE